MNKAKGNGAMVAETLIGLICGAGDGREVPWSEIKSSVEGAYAVGNWLTEVRGPLQWLIDRGAVRRAPDVHAERYVCLMDAESALALLPGRAPTRARTRTRR